MTQEALQQIKEAQLNVSPELAQLYTENAEVGAANLGGELPQLKIHSVGKSSTNELAEGGEPKDGWFFYSATAEQFEKPVCHILNISRGYRADGLEGKKDVFHQLVGGVIVDGKTFKPFIFYFTGTKLNKLWDFGTEAGKYKRLKPVPIPMFALFVELGTEKYETTKFGKVWVPTFKILKTESGFPLIVTDAGEFNFLKDSALSIEDTMNSIIKNTETTSTEEIPLGQSTVPDAADDFIAEMERAKNADTTPTKSNPFA